EGAAGLAPRDQDIDVLLDTMRAELLETVSRDYAQILERDDLDRSVEVLYYAAQLRPDDPFLNQLLGAAFLRLKRWKDALPYLERAAAARPDDVNYQSNLAFAYEQSGRYGEALATVERLRAIDPAMQGLDAVKSRIEAETAKRGG
ncbi:MAG TPA: tetratricopeptide repeat protein, partial [Candidatus Binatia bacterium]|nr:tetratricopeptide repeat protein [Candidatus Binatia bacterium]